MLLSCSDAKQAKEKKSYLMFILPKKVESRSTISASEGFFIKYCCNHRKIELKAVTNSSGKPVEIAHLANRSSTNTQVSYLRSSSCLNCFMVLPNYHSFYNEKREHLRVAVQTVSLGKHSTDLSD